MPQSPDHLHWLRARIASIVIDWPGVSIAWRTDTTDDTRLLVRARDEAMARAFVKAVAAELRIVAERRERVNGER